MSDIVGKLRVFASPRNPSRIMDKATITEAADEIERLTEIEGRIRGYYNDLQAHHEKFCLPSCGMIEVLANEDGSIRVRTNDGAVLIIPEVSNTITIKHLDPMYE